MKFFRFAQWRIERTGAGVLAFVTNHGYLQNPTFRAMRKSLLETFDRMYIVDLHGNSKRKEVAPGGADDENVFDIRSGVAICFLIRLENRGTKSAEVFQCDVWGRRSEKYDWLNRNSLSTTDFQSIMPSTPLFEFAPRNAEIAAEFAAMTALDQIFPVKNTGIITSRDKFVIDIDREKLAARIGSLLTMSPETAGAQFGLQDTREKTLSESFRILSTLNNINDYIREIEYRPFDRRWIFYHEALVRWPVTEIMSHVCANLNVAMMTTKKTEIGRGWEHVWCVDRLAQHHTVSMKEVNYVFPLKLKSSTLGDVQSRFNISPVILAACVNRFDLQAETAPQIIFEYVYGILHSRSYRSRYAEPLKSSYPHVPLSVPYTLFHQLAVLGRRLIELHLLRNGLGQVLPSFPVTGTNQVACWNFDSGKIWINQGQYFDGITQSTWDFHVGGFQVAEKWLKDRRDKVLGHEDLLHYRNFLGAIGATVRVMTEIDEVIDSQGGWPIEGSLSKAVPAGLLPA